MVGGHRPLVAVNRNDLVTFVERHIVGDVPAIAMDDDFLVALLARENRGKHDAVVVDAGLGVEDGHLVLSRCLLKEAFQHTPGRHAVSNDDEFFCHAFYSAASTKRWRS
jgi:hypothetical protein